MHFTPGRTSAPLVALLHQHGGDDEASDMLCELLQRNFLGDSENHNGRKKKLIPFIKNNAHGGCLKHTSGNSCSKTFLRVERQTRDLMNSNTETCFRICPVK